MELCIKEKGAVYTTSLILAGGLDVTHKNICQLIENHKTVLEKFGKLKERQQTLEITGQNDFSISNGEINKDSKNKDSIEKDKKRKGAGRPEEIYVLNEQQAAILLTYTRSTPITDKFRVDLIKEFYRMKDFIKNDIEVQKALMEVLHEKLEKTDNISYVSINKQANCYINKIYKTKDLTKETMNEEQLKKREEVVLEILKAKTLKDKGIIEHTGPYVKELFGIKEVK